MKTSILKWTVSFSLFFCLNGIASEDRDHSISRVRTITLDRQIGENKQLITLVGYVPAPVKAAGAIRFGKKEFQSFKKNVFDENGDVLKAYQILFGFPITWVANYTILMGKPFYTNILLAPSLSLVTSGILYAIYFRVNEKLLDEHNLSSQAYALLPSYWYQKSRILNLCKQIQILMSSNPDQSHITIFTEPNLLDQVSWKLARKANYRLIGRKSERLSDVLGQVQQNSTQGAS